MESVLPTGGRQPADATFSRRKSVMNLHNMLPKRITSVIIEIIIAAAFLLIAIIVGLCLFYRHPADYVWLPSCLFRTWTGLLCPGCGAMRATHFFLNGQFAVAFRCQPLLFSLLPILALLISKLCYERIRNTTVKLPFETQIYWLILIAICSFFFLRNIPLDCFDCLRPPSR
jgi:hypothetical protein